MKRLSLLYGLFILPLPVFVHNALSAPSSFTVSPTQTQITLSSHIDAYGELSAPVTPQEAGSLTAAYGGTINVAISASTIQFTGSSLIAAQTNALPQQPAPGGIAGSAPADYGGLAQENLFFYMIKMNLALRNVVLDVTSPALTVADNNFPVSQLQFLFSSNVTETIDYLDNIGDAGTANLTGTSVDAASTSASLMVTNGMQILTIPVNMTFTQGSGALDGTTLDMVGQIVATQPLVAPTIVSITVTNQMVALTVTNAAPGSQIQSSTDMQTWSTATASAAISSELSIFTLPVSGDVEFFRVQQ